MLNDEIEKKNQLKNDLKKRYELTRTCNSSHKTKIIP